jgi:iron uptake system component EfeO
MLFWLACAPDPESAAILDVKELVGTDLATLHESAESLRNTVPATAAGWTGDLEVQRGDWKDARTAYERVEGAIAVLFPDLDASTDERYDGFLAEGPDDYLFDDRGVTGVHAVERVLWAGEHPQRVIDFESALTGYVPAAFPATDQEATDFRDELCARLEEDVHTMDADFAPLALDAAAAYGGVVGSMAEQVEKVSLGATGEDESRYAQHTLADMRANLAGGRAIYGAFSEWIADVDPDSDAAIQAGFDRMESALDLPGDALPAVPDTWNPDAPSAADLGTDYGELWRRVHEESDPAKDGSLVSALIAGGAAVGIVVSP